MATINVLLIEDDEDDFVLFRRFLKDSKLITCNLEWVRTYDEALAAMKERRHDAYVIDYRLGPKSGLSLLADVQDVARDAPVIMLTSMGGDESVALEAIARGAEDYLVKGEISAQLLEKTIQYAIERKRMRRAQEELVRRDAERSATEKRKDEFIGMVSHELKTPLTSQKMFLELLRRTLPEDADAQTHELHAKTVYQSERLEKLIAELLDVSKMQVGQLELRRETLDLETLVRDVAKDLQALHGTHTLTVTGNITKTVYADRDRITQVLINLVNNAVKYSPQDSLVSIELSDCTTDAGECAKVAVRDQGVGIALEEQHRIFDRFYRIEQNGNSDPGGLGMGLYISTGILKGHGSCVELESEIGNGSVFYFTLPFETVSAENRQ